MAKQKAVEVHPSVDHSGRFAIDALLRSKGFHIAHRRSGRPAIWVLRGKYFSQDDALKQCDFHDVQDALYLEELYNINIPEDMDFL